MLKLTWQRLQNAGCPGCGLSVDDMLEDTVENATLICPECGFQIEEDLILGWVVGKARCRICSHEDTFVAPMICDLDAMECSNCHNMTSEIVSDA